MSEPNSPTRKVHILRVPIFIPAFFTKELPRFVNPARLREGGFFRNVFIVMSGTGLAQLLGFGFSPILSRLYGPIDFGAFGSFNSVAGVLIAVATLQYADALMLPDSDKVAARLFVTSCLVAVAMTVALALICFLFAGFWLTALKAQGLSRWLWLLPVAILLNGLNQSLTGWCARKRAFRCTAAAQVTRSLTAGSTQAGAGLAGCGGGGLIGGGLAGEFFVGIALWRWVLQLDGGVLRTALRASLVKSTAAEYKDFPLYSAPQSLLNAASQGAPVILLIHCYGVAIGGLYAFAIRVLQAPMNFVLTSLRQVLFQRLSEVYNEGGELAGLFAKCSAGLFAVALLPAVVGFMFAPHVFAFVFGSKWFAAGQYAAWLILWFLPGFCNLPAVLLCRVLRLQKYLLLFDLALLSARIAMLVVGGTFLAPLQTIALFSLVGAAFNVFLILYIWRTLKARPLPAIRSRERR